MKGKEIPSVFLEPERYQGRPLLAILENYILACIGHLDSDKERLVSQAIQHVWDGGSDWKATLRQILHINESVEENFRQLWNRNQQIAKDNQTYLHPVQFAKMVVDTNFADFIDKLE